MVASPQVTVELMNHVDGILEIEILVQLIHSFLNNSLKHPLAARPFTASVHNTTKYCFISDVINKGITEIEFGEI